MAVLDLPDPMQTPPTVKTGATDDLLSQLAGDEIDRLLAEADVEPADDQEQPGTEYIAPPPNFDGALDPSEAARITPVADPVAPIETQALHSSSESVNGSAQHATASEPAVAPAEMGALLDTLSTTSTRMAPPAATPQPVSHAEPIASPSLAPTDSAAIIAAELETSEAERRALHGASFEPAVATDPGIDADAFDADPAMEGFEGNGPMPLLLRPLEWLNAPFGQTEDRTRETIGKIALLTLVNAIGVLIYVFLFRRR